MAPLPSDYRLLLNHERRLTRLEILLWVVFGEGALSVFGVRIFDALTLWGRP